MEPRRTGLPICQLRASNQEEHMARCPHPIGCQGEETDVPLHRRRAVLASAFATSFGGCSQRSGSLLTGDVVWKALETGKLSWVSRKSGPRSHFRCCTKETGAFQLVGGSEQTKT